MSRNTLLTGTAFYLLFCLIAFARFAGVPSSDVFSSDAADYSRAAIHLLQSNFYSLDGLHPFFAREPGQSMYLAVLYALFGIENPAALFLTQTILYFFATLWFVRSLTPMIGIRAASICFFLLLTFVSVFHSIFSGYRECLALVLMLSFASLYLSFLHDRTTMKAILTGSVLGLAILTYYSFLLFPFFLVIVLILEKVRWRHTLLLCLTPFVVVSPWMIRNASYGESARIESAQRMTYVWYVRAEQAEKVRGLEPLRCLWSEYISRDWSGRSEACSFNGVKNRMWPNGIPHGNEAQVTRVSQLRILRSFPSYLWFSLVDTIELHLPYVGAGWSFSYNLAASIASLVLYIGFFIGLRFVADRRFAIFTALLLYNTLFFILTDATPRYLTPVIFCYTVFAALGYSRLLLWIRSR